MDAVLASLGFVPPGRNERRLPPPYAEPTGPPAIPPRRHGATDGPRGGISIRSPAPHLRIPKPEPETGAVQQPRWADYMSYQSQIRAPDDPADTPGLNRAIQDSTAEADDSDWSLSDEEDVILKDVELSYQAGPSHVSCRR